MWKKKRSETMQRVIRNRFFWLFLVVMFALPVLPQPIRVPEYWVTLLNYIGLYSIVAIGLVLLTGIGGEERLRGGAVRGGCGDTPCRSERSRGGSRCSSCSAISTCSASTTASTVSRC